MSQLFLRIVNMSISAGYIVLAVIILRLVLKRAPKWIAVALWGMVGVRLICPFSIESVMSLIPSAETVSPEIMTQHTPDVDTGIPIINNALNPIIGESFAPAPGDSINPLQVWIPVLAAVWLIGIAAMLIYMAVSYIRVRRRVSTAVLVRENIFRSDSVPTPFVLGLVKPKIYIPFGMDEKDECYVVSHEASHIRRKDHLWKPLGFLLLALHWFNPLMWLGYVLLCRDIELACDERVIRELDRDSRAEYSEALLFCSVNRRMIAACPLAFGEVGVKDRVRSVLNYRKPAFWIILVAMVISAVAAVCLLTDPPVDKDGDGGRQSIAESTPDETSPANDPEDAPPTLEELDEICKELLVCDENHTYRGIISYICRVDAGHVFVAELLPYTSWGAASSRTIGDYVFTGYTGGSDSEEILIYNGESVKSISDAYYDKSISDGELESIYYKWIEYRLVSEYLNDLSDKYDLLGIERVTENSRVITYAMKVSPKEGAIGTDGETITIGDREFKDHGKNAFLYCYFKRGFGPGVYAIRSNDDIGDDLEALYEYWEANRAE